MRYAGLDDGTRPLPLSRALVSVAWVRQTQSIEATLMVTRIPAPTARPHHRWPALRRPS